ncbi:MAG: hypothetical protein ACLQNG_16315, partial [Acidimicrobiales bacterium]
ESLRRVGLESGRELASGGHRPTLAAGEGELVDRRAPANSEVPLNDASENLALVVTNSCSMIGRGGQLTDNLEAIRVRKAEPIPFDAWSRTCFEGMPLPELLPASPTEFFVAYFHERVVVKTADLDWDNRIACLSSDGVILLQQRLTHEVCRVILSTQVLESTLLPVYWENELQEEWNEKFVDQSLSTPDLLEQLAVEAAKFDVKLSAERSHKDDESGYVIKYTLRAELRNAHESKVRVAMRKIIDREKYDRRLLSQSAQRPTPGSA